MDNLLQGMEQVVVYIDDILITAESDEEHLAKLNEMLTRLEKAGVRLKLNKCAFMAPAVVYLGRRIDKDGLSTVDDRAEAITNMPPPTNLSKLRVFSTSTENSYKTSLQSSPRCTSSLGREYDGGGEKGRGKHSNLQNHC